jgi:DNA-binding XRE family transcriptional regulator
MKPPGDWTTTIRPTAAKLYKEMLATHGEQTVAIIEALEIARRRAEIDQTEKDWRKRHGSDLDAARGNYNSLRYLAGGNLLAEAGNLFKSLCGEFGAQRACHILEGLEREQNRCRWGKDMQAWRAIHGLTREQAAAVLELSVEDVEAIESNSLCAGPDAMRLIRPALKRIKSDLAIPQNEGQPC